MLESEKYQTFSHIVLIAFFAFAAMSVAYFSGVPSGNDRHQHYQFAYTIYDSLSNYQIYPSFADSFNQGYGDVGIRFYPPFAYYILSGFVLISGDWFYASLLTFTLIFFISGVGGYLWAREEFSPNQSLLAAAILIFAPHHINQIYNSFLFAEFSAVAVIPFCFLFITRICRKRKIQDVFGLATTYSLLILTHLPLTVIGSIVFAIYGLLLLEKKSAVKTIAKLCASVLLAISASSFYWIRMISENGWINHSKETYFQTDYNYDTNFLFAPSNIINSSTDNSFLWLADLMLLSVLLIAIPSLIFFVKERKSLPKFMIAVGVVFFFSVFMTTPLSKIIWDNLPFLQKLQFPWRWLGIVSCSGAVFASGGIIRASEIMKKNRNVLLPAGLGLIIFVFVTASSFIAKNALFTPKNDFNQMMNGIASTNSFDCWWTIWSDKQALQIRDKIVLEERSFEVRVWKPLERTVNVSAGNPGFMRVATFYYPHWKATVNGIATEVEKSDDGSILIPLTEAEAEVHLDFREPNFVKTANLLSIAVWLFLFFGRVITNGKQFSKREN